LTIAITEAQLTKRSIWRAVRSWTMQGRGVDLRRSTVDLDFTCFWAHQSADFRQISKIQPTFTSGEFLDQLCIDLTDRRASHDSRV
jgi:hypothetical protein